MQTHEFDPSAANPAKALDKQQDSKHDDKPNVEFIAEDRHGKARLRHRIPRLLVDLFHLHRTQWSVEK